MAESSFELAFGPQVGITPTLAALRKPVETFNQNLGRINALATLLSELALAGVRYGRESLGNTEPFSTGPRNAIIDGGDRWAARWEDIYEKVRLWPTTITGMHQLHYSAITTAWTAFEVLAEDLWVECLNDIPRLGFRALGAEPEPGDDEGEISRKRAVKCPIPVWLWERHDFNLKNKMGTILGAMRNFSRRDRVIESYLKVFGAPEEEIKEIFCNREITWLMALRHAILHNAGRVDQEFQESTQDHREFKALAMGEVIPVSTKTAVFLVSASCRWGARLIQIVDQRAAAEKQRKPSPPAS